jgi:large subunit ribosomal protein L29
MKASDLREKSVEDLLDLRKALTTDAFQNRLKNFTNRLDDTSSIRKTRRDLARLITVLHERKRSPAGGGASSTSSVAGASPVKPAVAHAAEAGVPVVASPSPAPEKTAKPKKRTARLSEGAAHAPVVAKKKSSKKGEAK